MPARIVQFLQGNALSRGVPRVALDVHPIEHHDCVLHPQFLVAMAEHVDDDVQVRMQVVGVRAQCCQLALDLFQLGGQLRRTGRRASSLSLEATAPRCNALILRRTMSRSRASSARSPLTSAMRASATVTK